MYQIRQHSSVSKQPNPQGVQQIKLNDGEPYVCEHILCGEKVNSRKNSIYDAIADESHNVIYVRSRKAK